MTHRVSKVLRAGLPLALLLLSPGLESYAAAAGSFASGARVSAPLVAGPAASVGVVRLPGVAGVDVSAVSSRPGAALSAGVSLHGSAIAGAPIAAPTSTLAKALPSPAMAGSSGAAPAAAAAAASANVPRGSGAKVSARAQLVSGAARVGTAAEPHGSAVAGKAALDQVFSGSADLGDEAVPAAVARGSEPGLGIRLERASAHGPATETDEPAAPRPPRAPRQSLGRSARVGFVAAVASVGIMLGTMIVANTLGYQFHAGYKAPIPEHMTAVTATTTLIAAAVLAPIAEEMIFRRGVMGTLVDRMPASVSATTRFLVPGVVSSLVFVSVHELSDPVLFASRFAGAMILSYVYHKEGYTGSMFAHGFYNGLLFMPAFIAVMLPGSLAALALAPASIYIGWRALKKLRAERADKKSGALVAYVVRPWQALLLAAALVAGCCAIMPNEFWVVGAVGWLGYAIKSRLGRRR